MIFNHSRFCGNMKGHHPVIPMFNTLDFYPCSFADSDITVLLQTSLIVPSKDKCEEGPQERFKFSKLLQAQQAYYFYEQGFSNDDKYPAKKLKCCTQWK